MSNAESRAEFIPPQPLAALRQKLRREKKRSDDGINSVLLKRAVADKFQPIDPWKSEDLLFRRRHLPHVEAHDATYFVSFSCDRRLYMPPRARSAVLAAIRSCDGRTIHLDAAVVMPDHAHAIFRLIPPQKLVQLMKQIKGGTAHRINEIIGRSGAVWSQESFDHVIRHETEWEEKLEYIRQNPVKRGIAPSPEAYEWLYVRASFLL